jgi:hypothetical protein
VTDNIVNLADKRQPVTYTVAITHHWDGTIEAWVEDVSDSPRSEQAVWDALKSIVELKFGREKNDDRH